MRRLPMPLVLGLLCTALVAGCTTVSQGEPGPATTGPAATTESQPSETDNPAEELPTDGAPAVNDPLDTSTFQQDPCGALTPSQSTELNVGSSGKPDEEALGKVCTWQNPETGGMAILAFLDKDPRGLSAVYHADKEGKWAYFDELPPVEGFPAVARGLTDERKKGGCSIVVGVSDEIAFSLFLQLSLANSGQKDPCDTAILVAGKALQTMKQGG
jgi:Protein of unknown function (DUF3558)